MKLPDCFKGATFDSRAIKPGMLFIALKGEKADGRDFIPAALKAGAAGILDGYEELWEAAREYRRTLKAKVVGVTGSAGKTTTKELLKAFLSKVGRTYATEGNFNNHIGLPVTILNTPRDTEFLVVEMGTNHPGEIAKLCDIAEPDAGLITSIGNAHIEFFGSREGIAKEKRTLLERAKEYGFEDAPVCEWMREKLAEKLPGEHNLMNASKAFKMAEHYGCTKEQALEALDGFELPGQRWKKSSVGGITVVNDAYNANPASMIAAMDAFCSLGCKGARWVVLGDMFELGDHAEKFHRETGAHVAELVANGLLNGLVAVGEASCKWTADEAAKGNCEIVRVRDAAEAGEAMKRVLKVGDSVLIKASHGMGLHSVPGWIS